MPLILLIILSCIICLIITVSIYWYNGSSNQERFQGDLIDLQESRWSGQAGLSPYTSIGKHIRLNRFDRPDDISTRPIQPRPGETKCNVCDCPTYLSKDSVCYRCQ